MFFKPPNVVTAQPHLQRIRTKVDVGGRGDCAFRAVAAGLLDNDVLNESLLKKFLKQYFLYYPKNRSERAFLSARETMKDLVRRIALPELLETMSYVLRQMAVDEIVDHPEIYQSPFVGAHEGTSPQEMRKNSTWADESALAALATSLNFSVTLSVVERNKELPLRLEYNKTSGLPEVYLTLEGDHYLPEVTKPDSYAVVKQRQAHPVKPAEVEKHDPDLAKILAQIEGENNQLLATYHQTEKSLQSALEAGELTMEDLLNCYISHRGRDYLKGRVRQVGLEHGSQYFFEALTAHQDKKLSTEQYQSLKHDDLICQELVHALARAVSIGEVPEEAVFAPMKNRESNVLRLRK